MLKIRALQLLPLNVFRDASDPGNTCITGLYNTLAVEYLRSEQEEGRKLSVFRADEPNNIHQSAPRGLERSRRGQRARARCYFRDIGHIVSAALFPAALSFYMHFAWPGKMPVAFLDNDAPPDGVVDAWSMCACPLGRLTPGDETRPDVARLGEAQVRRFSAEPAGHARARFNESHAQKEDN